MPQTFLFVGLGNPGEKYSGTRHNVGFDVIDAMAAGYADGDSFVQKWDALAMKVSLWGATIHLVKPQTYMNLSGRAVARYLDFYKVPLDSMVVIHDDLDMRTGRLKLVSGGGTGGHHGIRSIVESIGDNKFYRLKIGIGRPGSGSGLVQIPVEKYVLTSFCPEEATLITERMTDILTGLRKFVEDTPLQSMNYLNSFK